MIVNNEFRERLQTAYAHHDRLLQAGALSVEPRLGQLAILVSDWTRDDVPLSPEAQVAAMNEEADILEALAKEQGHYADVDIRRRVNRATMLDAINDDEIAGITLIGHGNASTLYTRGASSLKWYTAAASTDHLKLGELVQRMCGRVFDGEIAIGTLLVADQRKVYAALGQSVPDFVIEDDLFVPVYDKPQNTPDEIAALHAKYIV